jgi:uncharacterized membrane protein YedE/YeeE
MRLGLGCVMALLLLTAHVHAQCASNASSCVACHEAQGLRPVLASAQAWHRDHAFGDLCAACHAGDPTAESKASAHIGLQQPLLAGSTACVGCHAADASVRSARYVSALFETGPGAAPPPARHAAVSGKLADGVLSGVALALAVALYFAWRGGSGPVCGVLIGSWAASRWAGQARLRWLPDTQWEARFGSSRQLRMLVAFSGAALVQFGAGIAGGCTSGLAISGGAALAPGAFLFMAGMFASGIPSAWLCYRGRRD